jgi:hypothetical protein
MRKHYVGRRASVRPVNVSLDHEAAELLDRVAPSPKTRGQFLARLLYEHAARLEERQRLLAEMQPAVRVK